MYKRLILVLVSVLAFSSAGYAIDKGAVELGTDASMVFESVYGHNYFSLTAPTQFRFGAFVSPNASLELRLATVLVSSGGGTATATSLMLGVSAHFSGAASSPLPFAEVVATMDAVTGHHDASQFGLGGGVGVKGHGHPFNPRVELMVVRRMESERYAGVTTVQVNLGVSFFSK